MANIAERESQVSISAQNTFSTSLYLPGTGRKKFTALVVAGTHVLTPTLQISEDNTNWSDFDADNFQALTNVGAIRSGEIHGDWYLRIGVKTGDYTSGTAVMHIKRSF